MPQKRMPWKGEPSLAILSTTGCATLAMQPLFQFGAHQAVRGVGPHASGVGAGVALADALVVLRCGQCNRVFSVAEGEEGELLAFEELLENQFFLGCSQQRAGKDLCGGLFGLDVGVAEDYTLAGSEAVGLDYDG